MNNLIETYQNILKEDVDLFWYYIVCYESVMSFGSHNIRAKLVITNDVYAKTTKSKFYKDLKRRDIVVIVDKKNIWTDEYAKYVARKYNKQYYRVDCKKYSMKDYLYIDRVDYE